MVINKIGWNSVCQHTQGGCHLLVGTMPKLAASIPSLLEKPIMLRHLLANMFEQFDTHPKMATEVTLRENWFIHKIATNQLVVPLNVLPSQLPATENGTTMLWLLCAHSQNHQHIFFLF
jgi:hypothetical protein